MRPAIVYMATNRVNGKRYIGVTGDTLDMRRYKHEWQALNGRRIQCRAFHAAIKKYGREAFDWTILSEWPSFTDGLAEEVRIIAIERPEYNLTAGGNGTRGHKRSPEAIAKFVAKMRGRKQSPEHIRKCAESRRGRVFSAETRKKISTALRGRPISREHYQKLAAGKAKWKITPEYREQMRAAANRRWARQREATHAG